ncbi:pilus assembly FimT family protein [Trichlorobacter ammonificans]|uniref:Prepilin-type N-terminal cleavage/methylation domain-containing protein n=1 Tax=Trichlorobacter ammonificans TaxID=2916410 RepID=A0ABM9D4E4_9BACT|nr:prepilin-type N-terminal cleavage/methylation domain-containing protein [Trichlorobacter ammonificans]CAH2030121.1 Prepilin-type N-terminal cleavage/methylation domain-containing protein [Trichlorobacter ammonificans]
MRRHGIQGRGFALLELVVVLGIIGILLTLVTLNFTSWSRKSQIERQTRELFADLNQARTDSIFMKKRHKVVLQPQSYTFYRFSSADENRSTGGTALFTKPLAYPLTKASGASIANRIFEFDIRGFTNDLDTIKITAPSDIRAQVDCIVVHYGRTNLGRMENNACALQ